MVAKKFQKVLPIKIINQPIKGIIPTVESAWKKAHGQLILRTDADAVLPPDWVKNYKTYFQNHSEVDAASGPVLASDGDILDKMIMFISQFPGYYLASLYLGHRLLLGPNFAVRKSVMRKIGGYRVRNAAPQVDDQIISRKLKSNHCTEKWLINCYNFHSTRRWSHNRLKYFKVFQSIINPKYYEERSH